MHKHGVGIGGRGGKENIYKGICSGVLGVEGRVLQEVLKVLAILPKCHGTFLCLLLQPPNVDRCHASHEGHKDLHHPNLGIVVLLVHGQHLPHQVLLPAKVEECLVNHLSQIMKPLLHGSVMGPQQLVHSLDGNSCGEGNMCGLDSWQQHHGHMHTLA